MIVEDKGRVVVSNDDNFEDFTTKSPSDLLRKIASASKLAPPPKRRKNDQVEKKKQVEDKLVRP